MLLDERWCFQYYAIDAIDALFSFFFVICSFLIFSPIMTALPPFAFPADRPPPLERRSSQYSVITCTPIRMMALGQEGNADIRKKTSKKGWPARGKKKRDSFIGKENIVILPKKTLNSLWESSIFLQSDDGGPGLKERKIKFGWWRNYSSGTKMLTHPVPSFRPTPPAQLC